MDKALIEKVHKKANAELYQKYPLYDMANLEKNPEGSIKMWQVEYVLNAYEELKEKK